jgi:type II secretory pathway pseudopilin PulG
MRHLLLLMLLAGAAGWVAIRYYRQQNQLHQQLEQLTAVLLVENNFASRAADNAIKKIEEDAARNRNQPTDMVLVHRAEALQARAKHLVEALRTTGDQLRRATGNPGAQPLQHLGALIGTALSPNASHRQALAHQTTAYADTLRLLKLLDTKAPSLQSPVFEYDTPMTEALTDLARLESEVLAQQAYALQRLSAGVGARRLLTYPLAIATAASNVVAPGNVYRAHLGLVGYFSANQLKMKMTCNGRPVPLTPTGIGLVRFHAPTRPGPATWTGTIRINSNDRDSTFRVTVPYRVVRR